MENTTRNQSLHEASIWSKQGYMVYGIVMASILTIGFVGNVLTLLVLQRNEHRSRSVTPLMINLACAGLFIIVFGYPVAINANLAGGILEEGGHCKWLGFTNGMIGITSIVTLTEIGLVSYHGLKQVNTTQRLSARQVTLLICGAWLYGGVSMLPPLLGWNRFVLTSSKVSCCPDWAAKSASAVTYNLFLVILGFFIPLLAMIGCYYKIYNLVHQNVVPGNVEIQLRQRTSLMKIVRMTAMSVLAFVLSWSPYCVVSLTTVFAGRHVISPGEPDFAAMLAKTSVIYNPIVYTVLNTRFRATLVRILHLPRRKQRFDVAVPRRKSQSLVQEDPIQLETVREIEEPTFMRRNPRT